MFSKTNIIATLLGFVVLFVGGYVFYTFLIPDFYALHTINDAEKEIPDMAFIAIGCLIQAFVMASLYSKWSGGNHSAKQGFCFGAFIGLFVGFGIGLITYGVMDLMDLTGHLVDGVWSIVFYGLAGMVISLAYGKFSS